MAYGWWLPGLVTLVVFVLMNLAKDNAPWPIHIGLALAFLGCAGWTALACHAQRPAIASLCRCAIVM